MPIVFKHWHCSIKTFKYVMQQKKNFPVANFNISSPQTIRISIKSLDVDIQKIFYNIRRRITVTKKNCSISFSTQEMVYFIYFFFPKQQTININSKIVKVKEIYTLKCLSSDTYLKKDNLHFTSWYDLLIWLISEIN